MNKARNKVNRTGSKTAKAVKPPTGKTPIITAAEARRRAERHVLQRMLKGAKVRDGAAFRLDIYNRGNWAGQDAWVVYLNPPSETQELRPSQIIVVSKRTGRVLYEGSAQDEG